MDAKQCREQADMLFGKKSTLNLLHQEIADHFYPERADFAYQRYLGTDFAAHLTTSYPMLVRRELGNMVGTMLRNESKTWFHNGLDDPKKETVNVRRWLDWFEEVQRRAMYDRTTQMHRALPEADHDYACFGQTAISCRLNRNRTSLLYRTWHIRDMVWSENNEGKIGFIGRKWKPTVQQLAQDFGRDKLPQSLKDIIDKEPFTIVDCYHIVCETDTYTGAYTTDKAGMSPAAARHARRFPWTSIYIICGDNQSDVLEAIGVKLNEYCIPRWMTVSGSQYAFSPATVAALPEGRLLQAMTHTLLEASEKAVYPPMIATENAVRSDVALYAGGITWVDEEYDERLGESLRPLTQDFRGMPAGKEMLMDSRSIIRSAFYLDRLTLPTTTPEMTAYEVGQRVAQYVRDALPLFGPMEFDYNGQLCELTFNTLLNEGAFGRVQDWPAELQGQEMQFRFESPLHDMIEAQKGQKILEAKQLVVSVLDLDPSTRHVGDWKTALREAMIASKIPATWILTEDQTNQLAAQDAQNQATAGQLQALDTTSKAAASLASARKDYIGGNAMQPQAPQTQGA